MFSKDNVHVGYSSHVNMMSEWAQSQSEIVAITPKYISPPTDRDHPPFINGSDFLRLNVMTGEEGCLASLLCLWSEEVSDSAVQCGGRMERRSLTSIVARFQRIGSTSAFIPPSVRAEWEWRFARIGRFQFHPRSHSSVLLSSEKQKKQSHNNLEQARKSRGVSIRIGRKLRLI